MTPTPAPLPALQPCPFCGAAPTEQAIEPHKHAMLLDGLRMPDHPGSHVIECGCGAGLIDDTRTAVVSRWNRRPALAAQPAQSTHPADVSKDGAQIDMAPPTEQRAAALALLKRIRYHAKRHALPRDWLTAADEVLGTWHPVKLTHPEIAAAHAQQPAPAASVPPGWKLVPVEPTPEILAAIYANERDSRAAWCAALAAAPTDGGQG